MMLSDELEIAGFSDTIGAQHAGGILIEKLPIARVSRCGSVLWNNQLSAMLDPVVQHDRSQKHHLGHGHDRLSVAHG